MPEELRFLLRSGLYGLVIGSIYWFVSYEWAGTLMLIGVGIATGALWLIISAQLRVHGQRLSGRPWTWLLLTAADQPGGMSDESGRLPGHSTAPLTVGFGLALAGLGLVFGPALIVAATVPIAIGLRSWLISGMAEYAALEAASGAGGAAAAATAVEKSPSRPEGTPGRA
jgi:Cytochrome c oxidase subunit IV